MSHRLAGSAPPCISVIVPHLNQPAMLARCLASLAEGHRPPDEIVVVDNGSAELPRSICAKYPRVELLQELTPGPGPARNRGIAAASGDILAFIDADCIADPDWLSAAEKAMADPEAMVLGGDVRIALADPARLTALEAYESIYAYRMDRYIARENFTGTGNLLMRRHVFEDVGPFAGLAVAEDRDWGRRATAKGYRIRYVAAMRVYHPARQSFSEIERKWQRQTAHDYADMRAKPFGRVRWVAKMLAMGVSPVAEIPRILREDRVSGMRNRLLAFMALVRIRFYRAWLMARLLADPKARHMAASWNRSGQ